MLPQNRGRGADSGQERTFRSGPDAFPGKLAAISAYDPFETFADWLDPILSGRCENKNEADSSRADLPRDSTASTRIARENLRSPP